MGKIFELKHYCHGWSTTSEMITSDYLKLDRVEADLLLMRPLYKPLQSTMFTSLVKIFVKVTDFQAI